MADLLEVSRGVVDALEVAETNLGDIRDLTELNLIFHQNATEAVTIALEKARSLNRSLEAQDADRLSSLVARSTLPEVLAGTRPGGHRELADLRAKVERMQAPQIDTAELERTLKDLEQELTELGRSSLEKGVGVLASLAKLVLP
jgi:hypothetical protein